MQLLKKTSSYDAGHNRCSGKLIVRFCNGILSQGDASNRNKNTFRAKYVAVQQLQIEVNPRNSAYS
jgi:hypothetical protein